MVTEAPLFGELKPSQRILMGPGPSDVDPRVLKAMSTPLIGHLDPEFIQLMDETQAMLKYVFQTESHLTLPVSATGSAGMEACVVNLIEPGDRMLVCVNGVFGQRMADVAARAGAEVSIVERPWGEVFTVDEIRQAIVKHEPQVVGIVHAETSTGARQPLKEMGPMVHETDCLLLVDCVTSLCGIPVLVDEWEIDAAYSGTQKCLSCPPGLAPVTFSARAGEKMKNRSSRVQSWYLDMSMVEKYWGEERVYHHTAPITMNYALSEALRTVCEEGLENRWKRHYDNHLALKSGLSALGVSYSAQEGNQLPQLNAVHIPDGIDDARARRFLLNTFGIEIGGGLGAFKGKVWRIGLMGHTAQPKNVLLFLAGLEQALLDQGYQLDAGASVAAANLVYAQTRRT